jgi:membrane-associated phospholipid phosphatase
MNDRANGASISTPCSGCSGPPWPFATCCVAVQPWSVSEPSGHGISYDAIALAAMLIVSASKAVL